MTKLLTVGEAAEIVRRHPVTVRKALESGEMHGMQRKARAHWLINEDCAVAWVTGERCAHQQQAAPARPLPLRIAS